MMSSTGMDLGASFVGTCVAAAIACIAMGFYSNWPIGLAPGMGLNAFFTYTVVGEMGYSWEIALGAVFLAGILFWIMSVTPLRQWMLGKYPYESENCNGMWSRSVHWIHWIKKWRNHSV